MEQAPTRSRLFEERLTYPDADAQDRLARLVGLDDHKARLTKLLGVLVNPASLSKWARAHHPDANKLLATVQSRPPLIVLAGDVGSGKTELAETIGDAVAREQHVDITLLPLSLSARGQGRVGEMTQLLSEAFEVAITEARKLKGTSSKPRGGMLLLVDEADALAQSREAAQMHHEDRAGVNALIRGVDRMAASHLPVAVIMCTNRLTALDPAVRRRAADILEFARPNEAHRRLLLAASLAPVGFSAEDIEALVAATGPQDGHRTGFTFSDMVQRLLPTIVLDAYPTTHINAARALAIAKQMAPTPPFRDEQP